VRFVETPIFTRLATTALSDEGYRALQTALLLRPEQGPIIQGAHGIRKLRWNLAGRGKRGSIRVLYYWDRPAETIYMLFLYKKCEQGDLTARQVRELARIVREEFK
jgi:hypothetical protein